MTLRHVAGQIGIDHSSLSRIERGKQTPRLSVLMNLADFFECGIDELVKQTPRNESAARGNSGSLSRNQRHQTTHKL